MVTLIAAVAANGVIGRAGDLPWHLPADLARFKRLTSGQTLVMGRKTYESIGRPLPGRRTIVVTRDPAWPADDVTAGGVTTATSIDAAIDIALEWAGDGSSGPDVFIAGGGEIYAATIDRADRLEITHVDVDVDGDTVFPAIDPARWRPVSTERGDGCTFVTYARCSPEG